MRVKLPVDEMYYLVSQWICDLSEMDIIKEEEIGEENYNRLVDDIIDSITTSNPLIVFQEEKYNETELEV